MKELKLHVKTDEPKVDVNIALSESLCSEETVETWPAAINVKEKREVQLKTILTAPQKVLPTCWGMC